jgi:hypothetical protein
VSGVFNKAVVKFVNPPIDADDPKAYDPHNFDLLDANLKGLMQNGQQLNLTEFSNTNNGPINAKNGNKPSVTMEVKQDSDLSLYLYFVYKIDDKREIKATAWTKLDSLLSPLLTKRAVENPFDTSSDDEFSNVLIADAATNGTVIFQQDYSEFRVISLDKLTLADEDQKLDFAVVSQSSGVADVNLAGSRFKLFFHPINLSVPQTGSAAKETHWIVCGLVPASQFRRETWAISYSVLIVFTCLPALGVLIWPFLKLMLIGPKDRLRTADVYFLSFAILIGIFLLTSLGLYGYSYLHLEGQMDDQLQQLSKNIRHNFDEELGAGLKQLELLTYTKQAQEDFLKLEKPNDVVSRNTVFNDLKLSSQPYPYFDTVAWIDPEGNQRIKWTNNESNTQLIPVAFRPYFSNLSEGRYRLFHDGQTEKRFWLEPILSRTTGRNEVEVSELVPGHPKWVSAFDARLLSLMQPVLPSGYGFAVIDNDGKVLFHSDETHHLGENFFQECDDNRQLLSAVLDRSEMRLDAQYLGSGYRLFTAPVNNFPNWSLIVFRDKQVLRTAFVEILTLSILLFLFYALILLAAVSIFYLININSHSRRAWLWPSETRTLSYLTSVVVLLIFSAVSFFLIFDRSRSSARVAILTCLISFLGIVFYLINLRLNFRTHVGETIKEFRLWKKTSRLRSRVDRYDLAYALNLSFLLLLISIMPSIAIFKFAYESEMELFIKYGQLTMANGLAERDERIRSRYQNPSGIWRDDDFIKNRLARTWDVYTNFFFHTTSPKTGQNPENSSQQEWPWSYIWIHDQIPILKDSIVKRGLFNKPFKDGSRSWFQPANDHQSLMLHAVIGRPGDPQSDYLVTQVPPFEVSRKVAALVFVLGFLPFFLLFYLIVRKVFLLDLHKPSSFSFHAWFSREIRGNCFMILEDPFTQDRSLNTTHFHVVDLKRMAHDVDWAEKFNYQGLPAKKIIAVDHFEYRLEEPEVNNQKTYFLDKLLAGWRVMVISAADPTHYSFTNGGHPGQNGADQWSEITSRFLKVYAEDDGSHTSFLDHLKKKEAEALSETGKTNRPAKEIKDLIETLRLECRGKVPLQQIGREILNQPGFFELTREHLINRIARQADTYYHHLWNCCSNGERLTLLHLAKDRLLSPKDRDVEPLMRRGLIVRDPDLHLINESFRRFVKAEFSSEISDEYQKAKKTSPWHNLKAPLLFALISVVLFLFVTQRDVYDSSLAILTAIITVIPAVFKLLSFFQKDSEGHLSQES